MNYLSVFRLFFLFICRSLPQWHSSSFTVSVTFFCVSLVSHSFLSLSSRGVFFFRLIFIFLSFSFEGEKILRSTAQVIASAENYNWPVGELHLIHKSHINKHTNIQPMKDNQQSYASFFFHSIWYFFYSCKIIDDEIAIITLWVQNNSNHKNESNFLSSHMQTSRNLSSLLLMIRMVLWKMFVKQFVFFFFFISFVSWRWRVQFTLATDLNRKTSLKVELMIDRCKARSEHLTFILIVIVSVDTQWNYNLLALWYSFSSC